MPKFPFSIGVALAVAIPVAVVLALLRIPDPQRALSEAVWAGDSLRARVAIHCGADINRHGGGSLPNIVAAGWRGDIQMIEFFLSRGVDIETADKFGGTALSRAAQNGHSAAVEFLLTHGANPNVKDKEGGNTPLDLAEMNHGRVIAALTDNSKIGSYMAKDMLAMDHGKEIFEDGDRKKGQAGAEKTTGSGDVRCRHDTRRGIQANRRELALGS